MTSIIVELLVAFPMLFNNLRVPQPPERLDSFKLPYSIIRIEKDEEAENKKLEEFDKHKLSSIDADSDNEQEETRESEPVVKKTIYTMTESELNALSIKQKAKLVHMSKKTFKTFTKLVNREAGPKMEDKIMVAAVVWNRKYCKQYPNTVKKVMYQGGQFTLKGQKKTVIYGDYKDKKAQLAILLAYRKVHTNQIAHNVMNFNAISYRQGRPSRFKKYKHYNNYFLRDTKCKCKWCTEGS